MDSCHQTTGIAALARAGGAVAAATTLDLGRARQRDSGGDVVMIDPQMKKRDRLFAQLADEGVPIAAIARATRHPFAEVEQSLKEAAEQGLIAALPPADWTAPREQRFGRAALATVRDHRLLNIADEETLIVPLMRAFKLTQQEALIVARLMTRETCAKATLFAALPNQEVDPKIVDVFICKIRAKLKPSGIAIETLWGVGYSLPAEQKKAVRAVIDGAQG